MNILFQNIFFQVAEWWEKRRVVRGDEFERSIGRLERLRVDAVEGNKEQIAALEKKIHELMMNEPAGTQELKKALALVQVRLQKLELWVGLARDPKPEQIPGGARIE